jgi:hypothetical protein
VAGLRPGLGLGGITHSLLVSVSGADVAAAGGEAAGWTCAGFMQSEGFRVRAGFVSGRAAFGSITCSGSVFEAIFDLVADSDSTRALPSRADHLKDSPDVRERGDIWRGVATDSNSGARSGSLTAIDASNQGW